MNQKEGRSTEMCVILRQTMTANTGDTSRITVTSWRTLNTFVFNFLPSYGQYVHILGMTFIHDYSH